MRDRLSAKGKPKIRGLGEDVLYLAIVNLPSPAEIETAKQKLQETRR